MKALLLSGGVDSTAMAYWQRPQIAITVDYGQAAAQAEIRAAAAVASALQIDHCVLTVDCSSLGAGCMVGKPTLALASTPEWWPYRNQLLVTVGAMALIGQGLQEIVLGTVAGDELHADGKAAFVETLDALMRMQEGSVRVLAPAIGMTSEKLLQLSGIPRSLLGWTFSCHVSEHACGRCRGCLKQRAVIGSL